MVFAPRSGGGVSAGFAPTIDFVRLHIYLEYVSWKKLKKHSLDLDSLLEPYN